MMVAGQQRPLAGHEVLLYWKRVLKRLDMTSRRWSLIEPGSCFAGTLAELRAGGDRAYMLDGRSRVDNRPLQPITLTEANFGPTRWATIDPAGNTVSGRSRRR